MVESEAHRMLKTIESAFGPNSPQSADARDLVKQTRMGGDTDPDLVARVFDHVDLVERWPAGAAAALGRQLADAANAVSDAAAAKDVRAVTDSLGKLRDVLHGGAVEDAARLYRLSLRSEMNLPDSREPEQVRCANCPCTEQHHESDYFDVDSDCDPAGRQCANECGCPGWEPLRPEAGD